MNDQHTIIDLREESKRVSNKLSDLKIVISNEMYQANYLDKRAKKNGEIARKLINFEQDMFSDFSIESGFLDMDQPVEKEKFEFWCKVLFTADKACRKVKQRFKQDGLSPDPAKRKNVFKSLVEEHMIVLTLLNDNIHLLPEETKDGLPEIVDHLQKLNFNKTIRYNNNNETKEKSLKEKATALELEIEAIKETIKKLNDEHKKAAIEETFYFKKHLALLKELKIKEQELENLKKEAK